MSHAPIEPVLMQRRGDAVTAEISRYFDEEPQALWSALTDPAIRINWLAPGDIDLHVGGRAHLDFADSGIVVDSAVTAVKPGEVLEFSWSAPGEPLRPLRWEIDAAPEGARLTLKMVLPAAEDVGRSCAGWSAHLEMMAAALAGAPMKFPFDRFKTARDTYRAQYAGA